MTHVASLKGNIFGWAISFIVIALILKLRICEIHIFELRNEEINVKKILAVINATYAVAKRKPEKIRLAGIRIAASLIFSGFLFATV